MITIKTKPDLSKYFIEVCDFTPILAQRMSFTFNEIANKSHTVHGAFNKANSIISDFIDMLQKKPIRAKKEAKEYGFNSPNEMIVVLDTFIETAEPEEFFIEHEEHDEEDEKKVWEKDGYTILVNSKTNATHVTLFKDRKKVGSLSTSGEYTNEQGKWLKISLADIIKSHRGYGLGKQLYKVLLEYSSPSYKGIVSYLPDRYNRVQVPKIYEKLGGFVEGDFAYIPKTTYLKEEIDIEYTNDGYKHIMSPIMKTKGSNRPKYSAYWLKNNLIFPVTKLHIDSIIEYPEKFGYTREDLEKVFDEFNEPYGHEGNARIKIIKDLMNKGWIRVRYTGRNDVWTLETSFLSTKVKDSIWCFFMLMTGHDIGEQKAIDDISPFSDVLINEIKPNENVSHRTSIKEILEFKGLFEGVELINSKLMLLEEY